LRCLHTAAASFGFALPVKMRMRSKAMAAIVPQNPGERSESAKARSEPRDST
jgi:hypothetical protein